MQYLSQDLTKTVGAICVIRSMLYRGKSVERSAIRSQFRSLNTRLAAGHGGLGMEVSRFNSTSYFLGVRLLHLSCCTWE